MSERPKPKLVKSDRRTPVDEPTRSADTIPNEQRALWSFLLLTLVGPFLAGLAVFLLAVGAGALQTGPPSLKGLPMRAIVERAAAWGVTGFVWSAVPAAVAGGVIAAWIFRTGRVPWLAAVVVAGVVASIAAALTGGVARDHLSAIALIAALVTLAVWGVLRRARIIG